MSYSTDDVLKPGQLTPTTSAQQLIAEITSKVIDVLHQTDHNLEGEIEANLASIIAKPDVFVDSTIPVGPVKLKDIWIDTSSNNQLKYCDNAYAFGAGIAGDWESTHDNDATTAAQAATSAAASATQTYFQDDEPTSANDGDLWVETDDNNQVWVYDSGTWTKTSDNVAQLAAASAQGVADGSTTTYYQNGVPSSADAADIWVDTDDSNAQRMCSSAYLVTDFAAPGFGGFANQTEGRESRWVSVSDKNAQSSADAAQAIADGKTTTFYQGAVPTEADIRDLWVNTTENNLVKVATAAYTDVSQPTTPGKEAQWTDTTDPAAQARADLAKKQADRKTITYFQNTVPSGVENLIDGDIEIADTWIDTNDSNASFICGFRFKAAGSFDEVTYANNDGEVYSGSTNYIIGDIVRENGLVYTALAANGPSTTAVTPVGNAATWDTNGGKTTDVTDTITLANLQLWREEQFAPTEDKNARDLANNAQSTADGKKRTFYQTGVPDPQVVGAIDIGDAWYDIDDNQAYVSNVVQPANQGANINNWDRSVDAIAEATANSARSAVDSKRTTYATAITDAQAQILHPGPGSEPNQVSILNWNDIVSATGVIGAQVGDLWTNIDPNNQLRRTKTCTLAYNGGGSEPGSIAANWEGSDSDAGISDLIAATVTDREGQPDGLATLDNTGRLPSAQLPISAMQFLGNHDPAGNTPVALNDTSGVRIQGDTYRISNAGSRDYGSGTLTFQVGDWIYYTGSVWEKGDNIDQVTSVFGRTGAVVADASDITNDTGITGASVSDALQTIDAKTLFNNGAIITAQATADNALPKSGGAMTGAIELAGTPSGDQAAKFNQIPTNNIGLTNGAGYVTSTTATATVVVQQWEFTTGNGLSGSANMIMPSAGNYLFMVSGFTINSTFPAWNVDVNGTTVCSASTGTDEQGVAGVGFSSTLLLTGLSAAASIAVTYAGISTAVGASAYVTVVALKVS